MITANLIDKVHPKTVVALAKSDGIKSDIPEVPAIALGSVDLSLYEMVGAYTPYANEGLYTKPTFIFVSKNYKWMFIGLDL